MLVDATSVLTVTALFCLPAFSPAVVLQCAGFILDSTVSIAARPTTCKLIKGDNSPGVFRRSMIRADISRLQPSSSLFG